jgi:hypothetical protein
MGLPSGLEGRCPRISGHSEASCTPYEVGNHTRIRPACGRVTLGRLSPSRAAIWVQPIFTRPPGSLREAHLARLAAQRPAVV